MKNEIYEIIAEKAAVRREDIVDDAKLEELSIDSLDVVDIIFAIEEKFDVNVPLNMNDRGIEFETVGDVIRAVQSLRF